MWFKVGNLPISPKVLAGIIIGGGIILIILILLCFFLCCWKKDGKGKKRPQNISVENPPEVKGNHHGETIQERKQQNNLPRPRMAEHNRVLNLGPSPVAAARPQMQQPPSQSPAHLPQQASISSTESNSIVPQSPRHSSTPQWNSAYMNQSGGSEISDLSGNENSLPPPSPALSFGSQQIMFTFEDLAIATRGFSKANILGQGGFGVVHKGVLPNGKEIAVKSLRANRGQGEREFRAEVEIISRVHHRHLVSLVGYNISGSQRLLVYEFVPNKTLEFHLYGKEQPAMDWPTRLKVAVGAAKGLAYLHEYCRPRIIHRDIKAANILLDNNFKAQVADFGLAKLASDADTHVSTRIMGTLGYLAPEYASTGKITEKSDVYSFGVVLLELITGRKPVDKTQEQQNLVEWIKPLLTTAIEDENFDRFVDPSLQYSYNHSEMARMVYCAATCVRNSSKRRPLMSQVVRALEGNISFGDLTKGITPGHSMVDRYKGSNKHSRRGSETGDSQYNSDSRAFDSTCTATSTREYASSDHDGVTSEYGLYLSSTSSEDESTRELETRDVQRENRRRLKQHKS